MKITLQNKKRYIRRVLTSAIKKHYSRWIGRQPFRNYFTLKEAVNSCSRLKMETIKDYIYESSYLHKNLWHVFKEIEDFRDIKDLLYYISLKSCYSPETILLQILRENKDFYIKNGDEGQVYLISSGVMTVIEDTDDLGPKIKTFIRYYTKLLLEIKKSPKTLRQLYHMFINKELSYDSARYGDIVLEIMKHNQKSIEEVIELISDDGLQSAKEIYLEIVRKDHNHFYRIIDDYYGSKDWDEELQFKGYFKLFDKYLYEKEYEKANQLGEK
ncbi:MAG: hypothetical protein ACOCZ5_03590, partial [bacterium]